MKKDITRQRVESALAALRRMKGNEADRQTIAALLQDVMPPVRTGEDTEINVNVRKGTYTREQPHIVTKWVCVRCGKEHEKVSMPGAKPMYCPPAADGTRSDCQRAANRERMREIRAAKRAKKAAGDTSQPDAGDTGRRGK